MTKEQDLAAAHNALCDWFYSQEIEPDDGREIMAVCIARSVWHSVNHDPVEAARLVDLLHLKMVRTLALLLAKGK